MDPVAVEAVAMWLWWGGEVGGGANGGACVSILVAYSAQGFLEQS